MQVILVTNIPKLGSVGDVVSIAPGYGKYLLNRHYAVCNSDENIDFYKKQRLEVEQRKQLSLQEAEHILEAINDKEVIFHKEASASGKMFGSIIPKDIAKAILDSYALHVSHAAILINDNVAIKYIGRYNATIRIHAELKEAIIHIVVKNSAKAAS